VGLKVHDINARLIKKAKQSVAKYRVSAFGLNKRGVVIFAACNTPRFNRKGGAVHAEMSVLKKAGPSLSAIIIVRIGATGQVLPLGPCEACAAKARDLGVKIRSIK
jgi:cytidine deaminase